MKKEDAAALLKIDGELSPKIVKDAYRKASSIYHPDKGGSTEMMQAVNEAFETLKDFTGEVKAGSFDYGDVLNSALNKIIGLAGIEIEVCGAWVWVTGDTKQHREALGKKGAGLFFASKKKSWYFRPDDWKSQNRGNWSMEKIRGEYGSQSVSGKKQLQLAG